MIVLAGITAYYIRFSEFTRDLRPVVFDLSFTSYLKILLLIASLWLVVFALAGLYNIKGLKKVVQEFYRVTLACSTGLMLIVILIFLRRELFDSRFIVLAGWILAILFISISRSLIRLLQRHLYKYNIGVHNIVLVGNSKTTESLMYEFSSNKRLGFEVIKRIRNFDIETAQELSEFLKTKEIDEIIQSDPNLSKAETLRLFDFADENHISFKYAADLLGTKVLKTDVAEIAGIPVVEVKKTPLDGWGRIVKRIFDIISSVILIILFSPILLLVAFLIKLDSRGPIFFSKRDDGSLLHRIGQGGKSFHYFKFRSM